MQIPSWLHWSHNDFYHPFLLRQVPMDGHRALDVGCGTGTSLAERVANVDGIDASKTCFDVPRTRSSDVHYVTGNFLTASLGIQLHHLRRGDGQNAEARAAVDRAGA